MNVQNVVFPENLGDSLGFNFRNGNKYDVKIDNDTLIFDEVIKVNPELVHKANSTSNDVTSIALVDGDLELTWEDASKKAVDLPQGLAKKIQVATFKPLAGNGVSDNPITLNHSDDFIVKDEKLYISETSGLISGILNRLKALENRT